jgi:hypothetical protein
MNNVKSPYCKFLVLFAALGLQIHILLAAELAIPAFPELPANVTGKEPLVVQLVSSSDHIIRYKPIDFYVRLKNRGGETLDLFLDYPEKIIECSNVDILFHTKNNTICRDKYCEQKKSRKDSSSIILLPNQSLVMKIPCCFIGKDADVVFVYRVIVEENKGYKERTVQSNLIHITVEEKPLSKEEIEEIQNRCQQLLTSIPNTFEDFRKRNNCNDEMLHLVFCSPYSLPLLKENFANSSSPIMRFFLVNSLSKIAEQYPALVKSDPSIADIFINRMQTEIDENVKIHFIGELSAFIDIMTDVQKIKSRSILFELLKDEREQVRCEAAFSLIFLPLTTKEKEHLINYLDNPHFLRPDSAKHLRGLMKGIEEDSAKKN